MNKIKTIARPAEKKVTGCGECRSTCQSACKTSCTVGNQSCERISRENNPEKNNCVIDNLFKEQSFCSLNFRSGKPVGAPFIGLMRIFKDNIVTEISPRAVLGRNDRHGDSSPRFS